MKYKYLILLNILYIGSVHAADGLGRLFFTPEQRAQLEIARSKRDLRAPANVNDTNTAAPAPQIPETITYSGVVRRSDGASTVWLNGKPVNERNRIGNANEVNVLGMRQDGSVAVAIPQAGRKASLKVGQSLDVSSGRIEESYLRRAAVPRPVDDAAPAIRAPTSPRPTRPPRESDFKESDPESGAIPAARAMRK